MGLTKKQAATANHKVNDLPSRHALPNENTCEKFPLTKNLHQELHLHVFSISWKTVGAVRLKRGYTPQRPWDTGTDKGFIPGTDYHFLPPSHSRGSALTDDAGWIALFILLFPHGGAGTEVAVVWESSSITALHQSQDVNQKQCRNTPRRTHTHIHTQSNYRTCSSLLTHCHDLVSSFTANFFSVCVQKSKDSHFWTICDRINSSGADRTRRSVSCRACIDDNGNNIPTNSSLLENNLTACVNGGKLEALKSIIVLFLTGQQRLVLSVSIEGIIIIAAISVCCVGTYPVNVHPSSLQWDTAESSTPAPLLSTLAIDFGWKREDWPVCSVNCEATFQVLLNNHTLIPLSSLM